MVYHCWLSISEQMMWSEKTKMKMERSQQLQDQEKQAIRDLNINSSWWWWSRWQRWIALLMPGNMLCKSGKLLQNTSDWYLYRDLLNEWNVYFTKKGLLRVDSGFTSPFLVVLNPTAYTWNPNLFVTAVTLNMHRTSAGYGQELVVQAQVRYYFWIWSFVSNY
jgi:hypothetical protein